MKPSFTWCLRILILLIIMQGIVPTTTPSDIRKKDMMQKVENHLLSMLGFKSKPIPTRVSRVEIHPYMMELYKYAARQNGQVLVEEEEDEQQQPPVRNNSLPDPDSVFHNDILANTVRSFTHSGHKDDEDHPSHTMVLRFDVSSIPSSEIQRAAELRIFHTIHPSAPLNKRTGERRKKEKFTVNDIVYLHRIKIFDIIKPSRKSVGPIHRFLAAKIVDSRASGSVSIDVSEALKRWAKTPRTNNGLYVEILPFRRDVSVLNSNASHIRLRRDAGVNSDFVMSEETEEPLLVVRTDDGKAKPRERRAAYEYKREGSLCQKYDMYVDFKRVEWTNWIVAPKGYHAFFCQGQCPFPLADHMNETNHAVIQNIVHSRSPGRVHGACCVPVDHSAISILYVDEYDRVVLKNYQDMVVESCGCR